MKAWKNKECCGGILFFGISLFVFWQTANFEKTLESFRGLGPEVVPNFLAGCMLVLSVLLYVDGLKKPASPGLGAFTRKHGQETVAAVSLFLLLVIMVALFEFLGFVIAAFLFTLAAGLLLGERRPLRLFLTALFLACGVYGAFAIGLNIMLPEGLLAYVSG